MEAFDFVIPLYKIRWNTRAVLEGITTHYQPRSIHVIAPSPEARSLEALAQDWDISTLYTYAEETFFAAALNLTKDKICAELDLGKSLYTPGWFYQQLLKLGAFEGIQDLSEWYVVWDSDLLPVAPWKLLQTTEEGGREILKHTFALLQHKDWGNPQIVSQWDTWISSVLGVNALTDYAGTFVPHHIWFKQEHLKSFAQQLGKYYNSETHWLILTMRSANEFGTFSEYWSYASWVAAQTPNDLSFYPYEQYGKTSERFFDDGTGLFSTTMKLNVGQKIKQNQVEPSQLESDNDAFSPSYAAVASFIKQEYGTDPLDPLDSLPSSLSFESSPRHLKKDEENMHIEELRSRWNPRNVNLNTNSAQKSS